MDRIEGSSLAELDLIVYCSLFPVRRERKLRNVVCKVERNKFRCSLDEWNMLWLPSFG